MVFSLLFAALLTFAQDVLTNEAVVKMVKAGLSESLIVTMVENQPGQFKLTADELVRLKQQGVSDKVLAAMVAKGSSAPTGPPAAASSEADLPQDLDIGMYFRRAGKWEELLPEVVNWKTGGVGKTIATVGIVKGDVNGKIDGPRSKTSISQPIEFLVKTPEGVAITEYQLLRLHEHNNTREFRTVTGGVLHASGGATRDAVGYDSKKVGNRLFKVVLQNLSSGEYGFLPPGATGSASSASLGKIYTFRILE